jgi:hypothetical protein
MKVLVESSGRAATFSNHFFQSSPCWKRYCSTFER